jgi:hypothetical protein
VACCTILKIEDPALVKPARTKCPHVCGDGCAIYSTRPAPCREYACLWLQGALGPEDRPDRSGVMLDFRATKFGAVCFAWPTFPGAFETPRAQALLDRLAEREPVLVMRENGLRELLGPAAEVRDIQARMERLDGGPGGGA